MTRQIKEKDITRFYCPECNALIGIEIKGNKKLSTPAHILNGFHGCNDDFSKHVIKCVYEGIIKYVLLSPKQRQSKKYKELREAVKGVTYNVLR